MSATQVEMLASGICDASGQPLSGGKVYTYAAGTTTPLGVYTDQGKTTPATNPVVLDSRGTALVFADGAFKFVIKTAADVTVTTLDNLQYGTTSATVGAGNVKWGGSSTNVSNDYSITASGTTSYAAGDTFAFLVNATNTGSATLNVSGVGAKALRKFDGTDSLVAGDLVAGALAFVVYDTTSPGFFHLVPYALANLLVSTQNLTIGTSTEHDIHFQTNSTTAVVLDHSVDNPWLRSLVDVKSVLGHSSYRWKNVYTDIVEDSVGKLEAKGVGGVQLINATTGKGVQFEGTPAFGPLTSAEIDLGGSSAKFKDAYLSGSVQGFTKHGTWDPAWTAAGGVSLGSIANYIAEYWDYGKLVVFTIHASMTTTGGTAAELYCKLPRSTADWYGSGTSNVMASVAWRNPSGSGTWTAGLALIADNTAASSSAVTIYSYNGTTVVGGASVEICISGHFEAA